MSLGARIRRYREARGLHQTELAALLGVRASSVCDWERGHTTPKIERLPALANALGCEITTLLGVRRRRRDTGRE